MDYQFQIDDFFPKMRRTDVKRPATPHFRRNTNLNSSTLMPISSRPPIQYQSQYQVPKTVPTPPHQQVKREMSQPTPIARKLARTSSSVSLNVSTIDTQPTQSSVPKSSHFFDPHCKVVTGNVENVFGSAKELQGAPHIYELFATILSTSQGRLPCEKLVVLRNKTGRVLQGVFYQVGALPYFPYLTKGDFVRCVGRICDNRFQIAKISKVPLHQQRMVDRLQNMGRYELKRSLSSHNLKF